MWGTFLLDIYQQQQARDVRDALETVLGPESGSGWATGGVYVFWNPDTREPLYVGIAGDLPERFAQHNGLRGCPASGCKREQLTKYFAEESERLGYTVIALSSLSQPSTHRQRKSLGLEDPELIELNEALAAEALDEIRALEGRMIALYAQQFGKPLRWNESPGRLPRVSPGSQDGTLATAVGIFDCLLQGRKTIRHLADDGEAMLFEEHLHGAHGCGANSDSQRSGLPQRRPALAPGERPSVLFPRRHDPGEWLSRSAQPCNDRPRPPPTGR